MIQVFNRKGMFIWLWRKRFQLFIRCRLFSEFNLTSQLTCYDFLKEDRDTMKQTGR